VELPPSPNPTNGLNESTGGIPLPVIPPGTGGLLFSSIAAPHDENRVETDTEYRARLAKEARSFLKGRDPSENNQEYQHHTVMRVALGAVFREHATTANADSLPIGR
jgi:hypothetical protein